MNIPEGFKLVPVNPTKEMLDVGHEAYCNQLGQEALVIYCTMLAAAPTPPQPIYDEAKERELFERILGSLMVDRFNSGEYKNIFVDNQWLGWLACAKSRANAVEVDHE